MILWPSPAKINLFLYINKKKKNGYHELQTLIQFINYYDQLSFKIDQSGIIKLNSNIDNIKEKNNLIFQAANSLINKAINKNKLTKKTGISIFIKKKIPLKSGLGGGSSNAATTLLVLNKILNINFSINQLTEIGLKLGADIPFFIQGHTALAEGIGEKLKFLCLPTTWYLIIHPNIGIQTKYIFQNQKFFDKKKTHNNLMSLPFKNNCENTARKKFIDFDIYMSILLNYANFRMTGTGDCIFAEFKNKIEAYKISKKLPNWMNFIIVKGLNKSPLHVLLNN